MMTPAPAAHPTPSTWITPPAQDDFDGLCARQQDKIRDALRRPEAHHNTKKVATCHGAKRRIVRVGELRILVETVGRRDYIVRIADRKNVYKNRIHLTSKASLDGSIPLEDFLMKNAPNHQPPAPAARSNGSAPSAPAPVENPAKTTSSENLVRAFGAFVTDTICDDIAAAKELVHEEVADLQRDLAIQSDRVDAIETQHAVLAAQTERGALGHRRLVRYVRANAAKTRALPILYDRLERTQAAHAAQAKIGLDDLARDLRETEQRLAADHKTLADDCSTAQGVAVRTAREQFDACMTAILVERRHRERAFSTLLQRYDSLDRRTAELPTLAADLAATREAVQPLPTRVAALEGLVAALYREQAAHSWPARRANWVAQCVALGRAIRTGAAHLAAWVRTTSISRTRTARRHPATSESVSSTEGR
jgi:hypothetical protein